MDAALQRGQRVLPVHVVGQSQVDGVDLSAGQQVLIVGIVADVLDAVAPGQCVGLGGVARYQCGDNGVAAMRHAREEGGLGDPTGPHHGIAHWPLHGAGGCGLQSRFCLVKSGSHDNSFAIVAHGCDAGWCDASFRAGSATK